VLQHQVTGEILDYAPMLYRSLLHELEDPSFDWERAFVIRERQVEFEQGLEATGRFGEIRSLIEAGLKARNVPTLKANIAALLALRESIASVSENRRLATSAMVLAVVLGLTGVPDVVEFLDAHFASHLPMLRMLPPASFPRIGILASATLLLLALVGMLGLRFFTWLSTLTRSRSRPAQRD
jgi:hypothetical protein